MSFTDADAYDRFMGRYSAQLSSQLADFAGVTRGQRVLDVGAGTGLLTAELTQRLGGEHVAAVDPSEQFVEALRARQPGVDIRQAFAEELPFDDGGFDVALAQLVVHFMTEPVSGLREMARVTRPAGVVATCVWDFGGGRGPISLFWTAARELDPGAGDEAARAGTRSGHLEELLANAGLGDVVGTELAVHVGPLGFDEWWHPFTFGVGPAGEYAASLDTADLEALRQRCLELAPDPLVVDAVAWAARGVVV